MRIPRSADVRPSKWDELRELEKELAYMMEDPMPRWSYNQSEWNQLLMKEAHLRKRIGGIKKELSSKIVE